MTYIVGSHSISHKNIILKICMFNITSSKPINRMSFVFIESTRKYSYRCDGTTVLNTST
jgi:hypothetical protein